MMNYGKTLLERIREEKSKAVYSDSKNKFFYLQHQIDDFQFQVRFKEIEKYGILLDYLAIHCQKPLMDVSVINRRLDEQVAAIQERITFLLEDFRLLEMDRQNKKAQLRSYPPYSQENSKFYYEIVLDEGCSLHFQRYEYSRDHRRYEKITSQLTIEIFERLVNEFVNILKG